MPTNLRENLYGFSHLISFNPQGKFQAFRSLPQNWPPLLNKHLTLSLTFPAVHKFCLPPPPFSSCRLPAWCHSFVQCLAFCFVTLPFPLTNWSGSCAPGHSGSFPDARLWLLQSVPHNSAIFFLYLPLFSLMIRLSPWQPLSDSWAAPMSSMSFIPTEKTGHRHALSLYLFILTCVLYFG